MTFDDIEDIRRITKGLSSDLVFRVVVKGTPYLLRIMTQMNERMDPGRIFACMTAAAEAGLAPCVRYSNVREGISITDFVEAAPLPTGQALVLIPATLRRLHALPPFPKEFNYVTAHNAFIWRFRNAGLLPEDEIEEVFTQYERLCALYPRLDSDMVSCHMDLKPENILFDGEKVWLVDWQAAFVNDRYFDLAVAGNFVVVDEADEFRFLNEYFGRRPDEYERARFFLMGQVAHMFYASVFLLLGSAGEPIDRSRDLPSFREFHRRIWAGEVNLADQDLKIGYGMVHWARLLENARHRRFEEVLGAVLEGNANKERTRTLLPGIR